MKSLEEASRISIAEVIRNARVFNLKNWNKGAMDIESLPEMVAGLFGLLYERKVDYLLVGGVALLQYVEGRNTEDIDLILALDSLTRLPEITIENRDGDFAHGRFGELKMDFLLTENRFFDEVRRRHAAVRRFSTETVHCATVEGLVVLKLYALPSLYRQGNFARVGLYENDIATLIREYKPNTDALLAELQPHLSDSDLAAVRRIVSEIRQRIDRFEQPPF